MPFRVACVGGGPGGLFLAGLLMAADSSTRVDVFERNHPDDTFGFGVVFSDATLGAIDAADPVVLDAIHGEAVRWDRIEVRLKGQRFSCGGNGMAAIQRRTLLKLLYERAHQVGAHLHFSTEARDLKLLDQYDLVVAADGANSWYRNQFEGDFATTVDTASAKFIWLGTTYPFTGLTFLHVRNDDGVFAVHGYPIGDGLGTFIVETDESTWRRAGLDDFDDSMPPGVSDTNSVAYLEELFGPELDGHKLLANNSRWSNFRTITNRVWHHDNLVLVGDAAHTAHFSVGSGTKMAMEDAGALADALTSNPNDVHAALEEYEALRRPPVAKIQSSSRPSLAWWEHFGLYHDTLDPPQFAFHFFSRAIGREQLMKRDPDFVAMIEAWWHREWGAAPDRAPFQVGPVQLPARLAMVRLPTPQEPGSLRCGDIELRVLGDWSHPPQGPWAACVEAPESERDLGSALHTTTAAIDSGAALIALAGGGPLARVRLSEEIRLQLGVPTMVVDNTMTMDAACTALLSGRADLVATTNKDRRA